MNKYYIESQYRLAFLDYKFSINDVQKHDALRRMAKLELIASEIFGFNFCDELEKMQKYLKG